MERKVLNLNGLWDFCPLYDVKCDLSLPENPVYEDTKIRVPSSWRADISYRDFHPFDINEYPDEWNKALTGVCRRFFSASAENGERILLRVNGIAQMAAIYINGNYVADWDEEFLPLTVDITDSVTDGENELQVVCTSFESCTIPSGGVKSTGLCGSWYGISARGIWQDITLETVPQTYITDLTVRTSVRKGTLEVIPELSGEFDGEIFTEVTDGGKTVMKFKCENGGTVKDWKDPILWDTENPHLYGITLTLEKNGEVVDRLSDRFGFREFWSEGPKFILNGTPINIRGDSWHFQGGIQCTKEYAENWYDICIENGANSVRLHAEPHPVCYLEAADEKGILIVDETAIYGSGKSMDAANPLYIERCKKHVERLIKRDKNHPSVVFWSLQNEMRWVDGRDVFKKHIPEMIEKMNRLDPTRKVSLDGDNRLISYENTQYESLHYNIDGTIAQWKREKPLTIGEHGGMWYLCPQNGSAYTGLQAYNSFEEAATAFAEKERLFVESARREEVSGISTFNFAYYYTYVMPEKDVYLGDGAPFKKIPKYSLSINNGLLKGYPKNIPNPLMPIMGECFKAVTVINREYDTSFYDDKSVARSFDVYNDTLKSHSVTLEYKWELDGKVIAEKEENFVQAPAEHYVWNTVSPEIKVSEKSELSLNVSLLHDGKEMLSRRFDYSLYPSAIKSEKVKTARKTAYYGGNAGYEAVSKTVACDRVSEIPSDSEYGLLIVGPYLKPDKDLQGRLEKFAANGGNVLITEQSDFSLGNTALQKQGFISAHSGMKQHPALNGLDDKDFMFWDPYTTEGEPESVILQNFKKPTDGAYKFILESDKGDYADGGDLWSPLMSVTSGSSEIMMCQLEIFSHFERVPQACVLLRNMIEYLGNLEPVNKGGIRALGQRAEELCSAVGAKISNGGVMLADANLCGTEAVKDFVLNGGTLITLPFDSEGERVLSDLTETEITVIHAPTCHLIKAQPSDVTFGISPVDLFHYDKVPMSPRQVQNTAAAENCIITGNGKTLITDVPGTPWEDYFGRSNSAEFCRIAIVMAAKENAEPKKTYMSEITLGKGRIILNQLCTDTENEKDMRTLRNLLDGCGVSVDNKLFSYQKSNFDFAADYFMTLPLEKWQNEDEVRAYYTDKEFSLNNLGEGLYGWMLKVEKSAEDGYITVPNSKGRKYFLTCFADKSGEDGEITVQLDSTAPAVLYVNGEKQKGGKCLFKKGVNRIVVEADNDKFDENLKFRVIFLSGGKPATDIRTHLTIDEVDPK